MLIRGDEMKKIILLLIILLCTGGCYDYHEINDLGIVVGIGLDYQDDKYLMTYELLNIQKENNNSEIENKSYIISAEGNTISDAKVNTEKKIDKTVSFSHLEILLISENLANSGISDMADYFLRNNSITNNFYMILSKEVLPEDILNFKSKTRQTNSAIIINLLKADNTSENIYTKDQFDYQMAKIKDNLEDIVIPSVTLKQEIEITELAAFKGDKLKYYLNNDDGDTYGLLLNKIKNNNLINDVGTIEVNHKQIKIDINNQTLNINVKIIAKIEKLNKKDLSLKNEDDLIKVENSYMNLLNDRINTLISNAKNEDCDILGVRKLIYKKNPKANLVNYNVDYNIDIDIKINRGGSLFGVLT